MTITGYGPPYGTGTSSTPNSANGSLLRDTLSGRNWGSRRIDPVTKDFVIDSDGRTLGMSDVQQLVLLAISTDLGSCAVRTLGQELKTIDRITPNFLRRVTETLSRAVAHLVDGGLIEIVGVTVDVVAPGRSSTRMLWRDLTEPPDAPPKETVI